MEKLSRARCLQERIGSCKGCPIQEIAINKIRAAKEGTVPSIIRRIIKAYCPEGNTMQLPKRPRQSIW